MGGYADHTMPSEIRRNMANALTHYAADVHGILAGRKDETDVGVGRRDLILFLREVFGDENSFHAVYEGQATRIDEKLRELDRDDFTRFPRGATDRAAGTVMDSAAVLGTLTQIRMVILSGPEGEDDAVATKARIDLYTGYGRPRLERMVQDRALEAGVPGEEIAETGSRASLLLNEVGQSYTVAAKTTEGVLLR
ncbi:hypothetical protein ACLIYP_09670 [Streptomyces nanhaiensis]|uniref:hypothetical protein n=1 Tax=Streptomyces nanhaiensis TaxID=679319 RepID=UPI00399D077B